MRSYECAVVLHPAVTEDGLKASTAKYVDVIARSGGEITRVETWGKRRLAYEIMRQPEGHYYFYKFRGANQLLDELGRQLRIDEQVLRHMITRDEQASGTEETLEPGTIEAVMRHPEREAREEVEHRGERYERHEREERR
ncbi:MAG TPA: 30S ribosomal protein S6 [Candidatus Krumholzibacteria bacterium]|nr:30S ribosomal protein S6 [Candidatus Krumholzibacteria bacterium]